MKRTKWFDGRKLIPAHVGVYERDYGGGIFPCYFDGEKFFVINSTSNKFYLAILQNLPWRGLKDKP